MSAASEAIVSNIETLIAEGYTVAISYKTASGDDGEWYGVYSVIVSKDGVIIAEGKDTILSEAMAGAYAMTPETETTE